MPRSFVALMTIAKSTHARTNARMPKIRPKSAVFLLVAFPMLAREKPTSPKIIASADISPPTNVPVAAVLVASIRLHFLDVLLHLRHHGPDVMPCDANLGKGEEMGWFEHGSTIIVFAPSDFALCVEEGQTIRMGEPLMRLP